MKIYRIAQQQQQPIDMNAAKPVMEAIQHINLAIANINKSLQVLETTGTAQLFTRQGVVEALQSGDLTGLDINNVNDALNAMQQISNSALMLNNALRIVKENPDAARMLQTDINVLSNMMVTSLQSGDYSQFNSMMGDFQSVVGGMAGTSAL